MPRVQTRKQSSHGKNASRTTKTWIFDVNSKIGSAMYHTGIGPTQVNNFLSTLNLPSINVKTLRRRCEEIGEELENLAENSVKDALKEEVKCTVTEVRRNVIDVPEESLAVSTDMHVNSDEDDYKDVAEVRRNGNDVPEESLAVSTDNMHVNFDEDDYKHVAEVRMNRIDLPEESLAVSTDMHVNFEEDDYKDVAEVRMNRIDLPEESLAVSTDMHVNFEEDDYKDVAEVRMNEIDVPEESLAVSTDMHVNFDEDDYNDVAGDERLPSRESTSKQHKKKTTAFEKNVIRNVDKDSQGSVQQSDTSMGITVSADGTFQKRGSGRCYNSLSGAASLIGLKTGKVVGFSSSYMIAQNTGNIYAIKENLESVVLHQFGEHDDCGNWCSFKGNPTGKHKNLPWGLDLSNNSLKNDLMSIFKTLDAEKLSKLGSSNVNESFNNILRSKAPKDKHYSESSSLAHRLSAAVCQKNEGYDYVAKVHQNLGLSPGNSTVSRANIMNKEVKRKKIMCKEKKYKRRRILLKVERLEETKTCEVREGDTYATDIMEKSAADLCTEEIPAVERKPQTCICFDLETTGLSRHSSIVQIAASNGSSSFSRYITPLSCNIFSEASKVTGITFDGKTMCNQGKELSPKGVVPTKHSLSSLVSKTVISKHICGKIQKAGLGYMHLLLAFKRGGFDGLQLLLGEKNEDAKVRVTRCMKVIENIAAHFRAEFQEE
uniref:Exonuclease domain-containing protein n=1 Tax=Magallana gigas TaxID=29159 RepID=A0A8W8JLN1_MAGGI